MNIVKMQVSQHGIEGRMLDRILLQLAHAVLDRDEYSANIYSGGTHTLWLKMSWADIIAFFLLAENRISHAHKNMHDALAMLRMQAGVYTENEIRRVMRDLLEAARVQGEYSEQMWTFVRSHPWTIRFLRVHNDKTDLLCRIACSPDAESGLLGDSGRQEEIPRSSEVFSVQVSSRCMNETLIFRFRAVGGGFYTYLPS